MQGPVPEGEGDEDLPVLPVLGPELLAVHPFSPDAFQQLAPEVDLSGQAPTLSQTANVIRLILKLDIWTNNLNFG